MGLHWITGGTQEFPESREAVPENYSDNQAATSGA